MIKPEEFWTLARLLVEEKNADEVRARTAAGRAYYALFLILRPAVKRKWNIVIHDDSRGHSELRRELKNRHLFKYADALDNWYRLREIADYKPESDIKTDEILFAINRDQQTLEDALTL